MADQLNPDQKSWADINDEEDQDSSSKESSSTTEPTEAPAEVTEVADKLEKLSTESPDTGLDDSTKQVIIEQDGADSPLQGVKTFEELNLKPKLLEGIYGMKFSKPSKIQEAALPYVLQNPPTNLIAQSQSGTGKTAAFALGILSRVEEELKEPQAICVCHTRELARQNHEVIKNMAKFTGIEILSVVRDAPLPDVKQIPHQVIVGTPGMLLGLIRKKRIITKNVKILVLDEADHMISLQNMGADSRRLKSMLPKSVQILLFSATYEAEVKEYALKYVPNPRVSIYLPKDELRADKIQQFFINCRDVQHKYEVLCDLYAYMTIGQSIVFVHTRNTAKEVARRMQAEGHTVSLLHGSDMAAAERDRVIDDFRSSKTKVLITTNVLARGIDVMQVSLVINYDLPMKRDMSGDAETYLHRIGRTGRWKHEGLAINLVHDARSRSILQMFERHFGKKITEIPADKLDQLDEMLQHCIGT